MGKYWLKIALGALLVFGVGFGVVSAGRHVRSSFESGSDVTIPLLGLVPFKLDGVEIGSLRSLVIRRSPSKAITGFGINTRITDSAVFERLRDCRVSVTDATHIDERTTFFCLKADSGYQPFGEVRVTLKVPGGMHTVVQPLLLPERAIQEFRREHGDSLPAAPAADSLAAAVQARVRTARQAYEDSVNAVRLENRARQMQRQADSLRAKRAQIPPSNSARPNP
jgi:hypothetical protein